MSPRRSKSRTTLGVRFQKSSKKDKKLSAIFSLPNGKERIVHFGANGMMDYTKYYAQNPELAETRKNLYIQRHEQREDWNNPMTSGALSRWILWNKKSLRESIADYKRHFKLM